MKYFLVLASFLCAYTLLSCNKASYSAQETQVQEAFLPVFSIPKIDRTKGNDLIGLSVHIAEETSESRLIEYTILFKDEDHPTKLFDFFYDIFRGFKYRRIVDVETFFILFQKNQDGSWKPMKIDYPTVFGKDQRFFEKNVKHFKASLEGNSFNYQQNRIIMYVNTWNHMFSNIDTNPDLEKELVSSYTVYQGTRADIDAFFK